MRPFWADLVIAAGSFWLVLLPLEFGGSSAITVAAAAAAVVFSLLQLGRWRRRRTRT